MADQETVRHGEWVAVAQWLAYAAAEFTHDRGTREYLEHVAGCVRDEGDRRFSPLKTPA